jgi:hypothetical protein
LNTVEGTELFAFTPAGAVITPSASHAVCPDTGQPFPASRELRPRQKEIDYKDSQEEGESEDDGEEKHKSKSDGSRKKKKKCEHPVHLSVASHAV